MEQLTSAVPDHLKRLVEASSVDDLQSISSSLLDFLQKSEQFQQMVTDMTVSLYEKNRETAINFKQNGNRYYFARDLDRSLSPYSMALRLAPVDAEDNGKNLVATLFVNRASLFHKMGLLIEAERDCSRALLISPTYSKALYRRRKVNGCLGYYEASIRDLTAALNFESSLIEKRHVQTELDKAISHSHTSTSSSNLQHFLRVIQRN